MDDIKAAAGSCELCKAALGKGYFKPRHHCRMCDALVCGACSESKVRLKPGEPLERACSACVESTKRAHTVKTRAQQLYMRLHAIASASTGNGEGAKLVGRFDKVEDA